MGKEYAPTPAERMARLTQKTRGALDGWLPARTPSIAENRREMHEQAAVTEAEMRANALGADKVELQARIERLEAALRQHMPNPLVMDTEGIEWCTSCGERYPCSGIAALSAPIGSTEEKCPTCGADTPEANVSYHWKADPIPLQGIERRTTTWEPINNDEAEEEVDGS